MVAPWRINMNIFSLRHLGQLIPRSVYHYESVTDSVEKGSSDQQQPYVSKLRRLQEQLSPRLLRRNLLLTTCLLLSLNTLRFYAPRGRFTTTALPVDWSQYAYCQYVTNEDYLCNSVMIFESLHRLHSLASRVMMYPQEWNVEEPTHRGQLLRKVRDEYNVDLQPVELQRGSGEPTWAESFTKLLAFNQTRYKRVLSLDSDATVLQPMDELFLLPSAPVAMPRAYWLSPSSNTTTSTTTTTPLSSQLLLIEPSPLQTTRLLTALAHRAPTDFDMELVNTLYGASCIVLPHRPYNLLTGEFRKKDHTAYLGSEEEVWDVERVFEEAKYLHFSDWPLPKPWVLASEGEKEVVAPGCGEVGVDGDGSGGEVRRRDCRDREKWYFVYDEFYARRQRVCSPMDARSYPATLPHISG